MRTLWILIWSVVLALGNAGTVAVAESTVASVPCTIGYDGRTSATKAYDAPTASVIGYDAAREHIADETGTATTGSSALFARFGEFLAAERGTTLYRAVGPAELADIQANGILRNLGSAEGKYFTTSAEAASSYAKQAVSAFGDPP